MASKQTRTSNLRSGAGITNPEGAVLRPEKTTVGISSGRGRVTSGVLPCKLSLSFVGGLCADRTGVTITEDRTMVGRGEECDIVLDGDTVSRVHCEVLHWGSVYVLKDCSRNGTYVNGERIAQVQINNGDHIRIGRNILVAHISSIANTGLLGGKKTSPGSKSSALNLGPHIVVKGLEEGVTQPFTEECITIGRGADNQLIIDEDNVSRKHFEIRRRDDQYIVTDLGSVNGTFIGSERIKSAVLADGNSIGFGDFQVSVSLRNRDCILMFRKSVR